MSFILGVSVRKIVLPVFLAVCATSVSAQVPTKGNIFVGYSFLHADLDSNNETNLNGWDGSLEGQIFPHVGIVVDLSGHYGKDDLPLGCSASASVCPQVHANSNIHSFLAGPQLSFSIGKISPFVHVLVGVAHVSASGGGLSDSDTSFATAVGGGLDYRFAHILGWRVQADFLGTRFFSNQQGDFRLATGPVLHF